MLEEWCSKWIGAYSVLCISMNFIEQNVIHTHFDRYANGESYEGYMKDSQRSGHGVLRSSMSQMTTYVGSWRNGLRHGYGVYSTQCKLCILFSS